MATIVTGTLGIDAVTVTRAIPKGQNLHRILTLPGNMFPKHSDDALVFGGFDYGTYGPVEIGIRVEEFKKDETRWPDSYALTISTVGKSMDDCQATIDEIVEQLHASEPVTLGPSMEEQLYQDAEKCALSLAKRFELYQTYDHLINLLEDKREEEVFHIKQNGGTPLAAARVIGFGTPKQLLENYGISLIRRVKGKLGGKNYSVSQVFVYGGGEFKVVGVRISTGTWPYCDQGENYQCNFTGCEPGSSYITLMKGANEEISVGSKVYQGGGYICGSRGMFGTLDRTREAWLSGIEHAPTIAIFSGLMREDMKSLANMLYLGRSKV